MRGDYYVSSAPGVFDFHEYKATAIDPNIEFPNLEGTFANLTGQRDYVAARWTGRITPEFSETYTFSVIGDNGFRLWVDGRLILDHWVDDWDIEYQSQPIALAAGHAYDFRIELFDNWGGSNLRLRWSSPSQPKEIVPPSAFTLPPDFAYDGPQPPTLQADGLTVPLTFPAELGALPAGLADHLRVEVGGIRWPLDGIVSTSPTTLRVALDAPVVGDGRNFRVRYDGSGGLKRADGTSVGAFDIYGLNGSKYQLRTPWADDVSATAPHPEYPRPQLVRSNWQSLNGRWEFSEAREGEAPPFGRTLGERILVPFPEESQLSGVEESYDRMWCRRTFQVPPGWNGQRLLLHFGAVDYAATVYVNGMQVTRHEGGYDAFSVDVTDSLRRDRRDQELVVGVVDSTERQPVGKQTNNPGGIWYTPSSGIWQSVWLEPVSATHVERLATTPDVAGSALRLTAHVAGSSSARVEAVAYDRGRVVGRVRGAPNTELRLPVPRPKLWSPDRPFLYDLVVRVGSDEVRSYFGMRTIALGTFNGKQRMLLNGKPLVHLGTLDQGYWPDGLYTAPTDEALRWDIEALKDLGFNTLRKHVKVEPSRYYYWADRLGILVWQDMPAQHDTSTPALRARFENELRAMVEQFGNHPSIVVWVPFNEGWGQYDGARITDWTKSLDPSRLVDGASGWNDTGNGDVIDHHAYPGPGSPAPSATRAAVTGEFGGLQLPVFGHSWSNESIYETLPSPSELTGRYEALLADVVKLVRCNGVSGAIYTQTTDLEHELNGLYTYDRKVTKLDARRVKAANEAVIAASELPAQC